MLNVEFTLSVLNLILIGCRRTVYRIYLRSRQLKKKQFKISELRKEIVNNHAQILELQMEYVALGKIYECEQGNRTYHEYQSLSETKEAACTDRFLFSCKQWRSFLQKCGDPFYKISGVPGFMLEFLLKFQLLLQIIC